MFIQSTFNMFELDICQKYIRHSQFDKGSSDNQCDAVIARETV